MRGKGAACCTRTITKQHLLFASSRSEEIDGYQVGETMSFKFWDASEGVEYDLDYLYPITMSAGANSKFGQGRLCDNGDGM